MARTDDDSWDLASSVGSTATLVAAQRAISNREGLIDDPYAEPLVRAVGLDFVNRALDGEIDLEDVDPRFNLRRAAEGSEPATSTGCSRTPRPRVSVRRSSWPPDWMPGHIGCPGLTARPCTRSTSPK